MRLRKNTKIDLIKSVPLFSQCTKKELAALAAEADEIDVVEGTALTRQGDRGREFMVIVEGAAEVRKNGRRINHLGSGDFLGEIALLTGANRTATVITTAPTRLLILTDRSLKRIRREMPSINASLVDALSARLQTDTL